MEIGLSRRQFETLLKAVYLADWMVNAIRAPGTYVPEFEELEKFVLSLAHRSGYDSEIDFDARLSQFFAKDTFHDTLQPFIDDYDEEAFWDGLIDRLADREFAATFGDDARHE